jgi:CRISPR-associated exonuclease Cas4
LNEFDPSVNLRSIQQYLYCPHRWGLMETDCAWAENVFVSRGNLAHERANEGKVSSAYGTVQERSVRVYNDEWDLFGVVDCLELKRSANGVTLPDREGKYAVCIVEYKVTAPKKGERIEDKMQLLGQKICVDSLFGCDAETCFYYQDTRKREKVVFEQADYTFLRETLSAMRTLKEAGKIPPVRKGQYCGGCSLKDICLPPKRNGGEGGRE